MPSNTYDRRRQDVGNIVALEHVNVWVPDQQLATIFWIVGMGFTRDPYLMVGVDNMWVNIGRQQFHLPTGEPQVVRGVVGLVVPDPGELTERLDAVRAPLRGTRRSEEHTSELQSLTNLVCRLLLEKKKKHTGPATVNTQTQHPTS